MTTVGPSRQYNAGTEHVGCSASVEGGGDVKTSRFWHCSTSCDEHSLGNTANVRHDRVFCLFFHALAHHRCVVCGKDVHGRGKGLPFDRVQLVLFFVVYSQVSASVRWVLYYYVPVVFFFLHQSIVIFIVLCFVCDDTFCR
ncbi:unnamed protein product, partial [Pylaiella littoralis]